MQHFKEERKKHFIRDALNMKVWITLLNGISNKFLVFFFGFYGV